MKRLITTIIVACAALLLTQCRKGVIEHTNGLISGETVDVSLNVENGDGQKTDIDGLTIKWEVGDKLYVVGSEDGCLGYVSAQTGGSSSAYFTGAISKAGSQDYHFYYIGNNDKQFTLDGSCNYTYDISDQDGTLDGIEDNLHVMHGVIENVASGVTNLGTVNMESMMSIVKLKFTKSEGNLSPKLACYGAITKATINTKSGILIPGIPDVIDLNGVTLNRKSTSESNDYYMALIPSPVSPANPEDKNQKLIFANEKLNDVYLTTSQMIKEVQSNKFYTSDGDPYGIAVSVSIDKKIEGALHGRFSIGVDDKGVKKYTYFSKGNLFYDDGKWSFQENQYTYSNGQWYLFAWSTVNNEYGKVDGTTQHTGAFRDWGVNPVDNGGNAQKLWFTFSKDEVDYIFKERETDLGKQLYGHAKVNEVTGLVVFPDNWVKPDDVNFTTGNVSYTTNVLTTTDWGKLEEAGAVFLPAAGYCSNGTYGAAGESGFYYARTYADSPVKNWDLYFSNQTITAPNSFSSNYDRLGVRLVYNGINYNYWGD